MEDYKLIVNRNKADQILFLTLWQDDLRLITMKIILQNREYNVQ